MAEPNGYIQGSNGVPLELVDSKARSALQKKLTRPATAQVGDYLRIKAIGADGTMEVEAVPAPTGGATVPTKVSAFENDAGYTTETRVQALLAAFPTFKIEVVQELPALGEEKTIYLVPFAGDSGSYLEYLYVNGAWEVVGSGKNSGENVTNADVSSIKTVLGNIMTIIKAQTDSEDGVERPQGYNMDVSGLVAQNDILIAALGGSGDSGGTTEKTLTSISATYTGGSVPVGTAVTALTGIEVTAHYSDGSASAVTGYTLSGTIAEGSNTITVSYGGKTADITVVGVAESAGDADHPFANVEWIQGLFVNINGVTATENRDNWYATDYVDISGYSAVTVQTTATTWSDVKISVYTADKVCLETSGVGGYVQVGSSNYPDHKTLNIPDEAVYCRISISKAPENFNILMEA